MINCSTFITKDDDNDNGLIEDLIVARISDIDVTTHVEYPLPRKPIDQLRFVLF